MKPKANFLTALDIGSYKVSGAVFHMNFDALKYQQSGKALHCLSAQMQQTKGFMNGSITHFDELENSILSTLTLLEKESDQTIQELYLSLPGHVFQSRFVAKTINLNGMSVSTTVVQNIIAEICQSNKEGETVHIAPIRFDIDDVSNIEDPYKMVGQQLTAYMHVMTASKTLMQNLRNLFARYDIKVLNILAAPVVQVLNMDPQEQGVILDFGHDSTNLVLYKNGKIVFHQALPIGGRALSQKISKAQGVSLEQAERLKSYNGYMSSVELTANGEFFKSSDLNVLIQYHMQEIIAYIKSRIEDFDSEFLKNISITGGSSELKGLATYIEGVLHRKVTILSAAEGMKSPAFSTCFGAIQYGYYQYCNQKRVETFSNNNRLWHKIKNWFNEDL